MARLRGPEGCPWDREQTVESLRHYLLEECYELLEALQDGDPAEVRGELGDVLFQIVFLSRIYEERGDFDLNQVAEAIAEKMVKRHPHVFGEQQLETAQDVLRNWSDFKAAERGEAAGERSLMDGIPRSLPALHRTWLMAERASHVGFDWPHVRAVIAKAREELDELEASLEQTGPGPEAVAELGDLLFSLACAARRLEANPEEVLQAANAKFARRFRALEQHLRKQGTAVGQATPEQLEQAWEQVKASEP